MAVETRYLVISADRSTRLTTRQPRLRADEIAIPIRLKFPIGWGRMAREAEINIEIPDFVPTVQQLGDPIFDTESDEALPPVPEEVR